MSDAQARASGASRRNPLPFVAAAVLLAFLAGLALMAIATGRYRWPAVPAPARAVRAAPPRPAASAPATPAVPTGTDPATLAGREALLGARLAAIEAALPAVSAAAAAAGGQAGRAEGMLLAFAARRAIDRGLGLGELERPFRARFAAAQPRAAALIVAASRGGSLTLEELRAGLDALAPALVSGSGAWWPGLRGQFSALIVLHRADTPSPVPADRLQRIRRQLDAGQVEAALTEVARMPGAADAGNWIGAARRYVDVHRALDAVEAAALAPPPAASPASPAPAPLPAQAAAAVPPTAAVPPAAATAPTS